MNITKTKSELIKALLEGKDALGFMVGRFDGSLQDQTNFKSYRKTSIEFVNRLGEQTEPTLTNLKRQKAILAWKTEGKSLKLKKPLK